MAPGNSDGTIQGPKTPKTPNMSTRRVSMLGETEGMFTPKSKPEDNHIRVVCRVRPLNEHTEGGNQTITSFPDDTTVTILGKDLNLGHNFTYDRVFNGTSTQQDIYEYSIKSTLEDVLNGYNGTILAYGQTGSGKSYTMLGPSINDEMSKGLIPRISDELFDRIKLGSPDIEYTVSISIMEIYLEQINDLLVENNTKLSIHEDKENGIHVKGLSYGSISSTKELYGFINLGIKNRTSTVTNMNMASSRSHAIFQIKVTQKNLRDESVKKSSLFLIDLAGSEKVDKTGAIGQTLQEAKNINSSLSALGNVINALTDHKSTHIPYRDSKLTRILQESLGGNSRTTLILNISPSYQNELETYSTLRFGSRAKTIKNRAYINTELSNNELKFRLKQLERENEQNRLYIEKLQNKLKYSESSPGPDYSKSPVTPKKDFESKIPVFKSSVSPISPNSSAKLLETLKAKDEKIKNLEEEILNNKITNLRISNDDEIKLNKLEKALNKLSGKLTDVEVININLRKHLMVSEKIIEQRDQSIEYLNKILTDQQKNLVNQSMNFENKLHLLKSRLQDQQISEKMNRQMSHLKVESNSPGQAYNSRLNSPTSPISPRTGLRLNIVKPIVGGHNDSEEEEDDYGFDDKSFHIHKKENINTAI